VTVDQHLLAQLLAVIALLGATIEYGEIIQRRHGLRQAATLSQEAADTGLQGLVRVLLADED
jgi:hypothetical protein